jgi:hypothetical protein
LPFDNARSLDFEAISSLHISGLDNAVARFNRPHPYLLFHAAAVPDIRRRAALNPQFQARAAKLLSATSTPLADAEPRTIIKRRARRLINTAFIAMAAERVLAARGDPRHARRTCGGADLEGAASDPLLSRLRRNRRSRCPCL